MPKTVTTRHKVATARKGSEPAKRDRDMVPMSLPVLMPFTIHDPEAVFKVTRADAWAELPHDLRDIDGAAQLIGESAMSEELLLAVPCEARQAPAVTALMANQLMDECHLRAEYDADRHLLYLWRSDKVAEPVAANREEPGKRASQQD